MSNLLEYKCPCCGGKIEFNSSLQQMKCPYCDSTLEVEGLKGYDEALRNDGADDMQWQNAAGSEWQPGETVGMRSYICQSCGGEVVCDQNTAASHCPYCDNPVIMQQQLSGSLRPDVVIPFKLDKQAAKNAYFQHLKGKRLLPKVFKSQNHIDEIKGVYVPFWLFDADADAHIRYHGTRVHTSRDSRYIYTETSHYAILRDGCIGFNHVPVDGSSRMADDLMESIEPYRFEDAVDFQTAYLSGYLADKYDVTAEQSVTRANQRIKRSTEEAFRETVQGYATVTTDNSSIRLFNGNAQYALYPVWLLNTTWRGKQYIFAMNGQTGKMVGDLPLDKGAFWRWWALWGTVITALTYLGIWLSNF